MGVDEDLCVACTYILAVYQSGWVDPVLWSACCQGVDGHDGQPDGSWSAVPRVSQPKNVCARMEGRAGAGERFADAGQVLLGELAAAVEQ